jgi:S-adenosylmethionine/arginine decarboxylase-like enzyme
MLRISPWGWSTSIDLYECDYDSIRSESRIRQFVIELTDLLEVKRFGDAIVVRFGADPKVCGYSMMQLIETSSISAHFIEQTNTVCLDIFSCADYDAKKAAELAGKFFGAKRADMATMTRGANATVIGICNPRATAQ